MARTVRFSIEAEVDERSLRGGAITSGGAREPFSGWLGLLAVIDRLIVTPPPSQPSATRDDEMRGR